MFKSLVMSTLFWASSAFAAPSQCPTMLQGNLSPNGISGNFELVNGQVVFMPGYLQTGFDVSLKSCNAANATPGSSYSPSGQLVAPNGQCLAAQNNIIVAVPCTDVAMQTQMTWSFDAFLYWNGPQTSACPSGLYGYTTRDNSGYPSQVQTAPIVLGCESAGGVFPFSLLM